MTKYWLTLLLGFTPLLTLAQTTGDVDELLLALAPIQHLQGSFSQSQFEQDDVLLAESSGRFRLLRPGYFYWEILTPDEQLIIAGPEYLWHFDRDLETVTRRPVTSDGQMTPLQILGGDDAALRENFSIVQQNEDTFLLTPLSPEVGFKQLTLHFNEAQLTGMEILDNLNQRIVIKFTELDAKSELTGSDFDFVPPAGADLFYYDE
jgi:outer membrane lipoprotein carrier protein